MLYCPMYAIGKGDKLCWCKMDMLPYRNTTAGHKNDLYIIAKIHYI